MEDGVPKGDLWPLNRNQFLTGKQGNVYDVRRRIAKEKAVSEKMCGEVQSCERKIIHHRIK